MFLQEGSRVSHPAPDGLSHFAARAICQGYDSVIIRSYGERKSEASLPGTVKTYARSLARSLKNIVRHHRDVELGPVGALRAFGIAASYYTLHFAGAVLTYARPKFIAHHFSIRYKEVSSALGLGVVAAQTELRKQKARQIKRIPDISFLGTVCKGVLMR
jgi:hypothetical protein